MWAQIKLYKNVILTMIFLAIVGASLYIGFKQGAADVQSKWDKETIVIKEREINLQTRILDITNQMNERDRAQAKKDAEAAAEAAKERARLQSQAETLQKNLERLTKTLPQYKECTLDPETLKELNRSLTK